MHACVYVRMCVCMYVCMCVYVHFKGRQEVRACKYVGQEEEAVDVRLTYLLATCLLAACLGRRGQEEEAVEVRRRQVRKCDVATRNHGQRQVRKCDDATRNHGQRQQPRPIDAPAGLIRYV